MLQNPDQGRKFSIVLYFIFLAILCLPLGVCAAEQCFECKSEGFFRIDNAPSTQQLWVEIDSLAYRPCRIPGSASIYVYCPQRGWGRLSSTAPSKNLAAAPAAFRTPYFERRRPRVYQYSVFAQHAPDHWFSGEAVEGQDFREMLPVGELPAGVSGLLDVYLYNFNPEEAYVQIKTKYHRRDTLLYQDGGFTLRIPITRKAFQDSIRLTTKFAKVGLIGYRFTGVQVQGQQEWPHLSWLKCDRAHLPTRTQAGGGYFCFQDRALMLKPLPTAKDITKKSPVQTFVFARLDSIAALALQPLTRPGIEESAAVCVLYHPIFADQMDQAAARFRAMLPTGQAMRLVDATQVIAGGDMRRSPADRIKDFLHALQPSHVLLIGDASCNAVVGPELIPTYFHLHRSQLTRTPSDHYYTFLDNPTEPRFAIGRLPFSTPGELAAYLQKLDRWTALRGSQQKSWIYDADGALRDSAMLPHDAAHYFAPTAGIPAQLRQPIHQLIQQSKATQVIYDGHGAFDGWGQEDLVRAFSFRALDSTRLFFLWDLSCWTGEFSHAQRRCFAEELLALQGGGPIGMVTSSAYTYGPAAHSVACFLADPAPATTVGHALLQAKVQGRKDNSFGYDDVFLFNLLGLPFTPLTPIN